MITVDEILNTMRVSRKSEESGDHKHELEDKEFNIEGHRVRGKVCRVCGERFFLVDDLLPIEQALHAAVSKAKQLSLKDAVILLAGVYPEVEVPGALVMQKEMFLFTEAFAPEFGLSIEPALYVPHHMGPYSRKLEKLLVELERAGLVETKPLSGREGESYKLTEAGKRLLEDKRRLVPDDVWRQLRRKRRAWDELGSQGLLRLVYDDFSAYAGRSKIRDRVEKGPRHED